MTILFDTSGRCLCPWRFVWMGPLVLEVLLLLLLSGHGDGNGCIPPLECVPLGNCSSQLGNRTNSYTLFPCGTGYNWVCCPLPKPQALSQAPSLTNKMALLPLDICGVTAGDKIINGEKANRGQFPWMALLGYKERNSEVIEFLCGGSIISDRYILTAAHCLTLEKYKLVTVRLGELNLTTDPDCELFCATTCEPVCADPIQEYEVENFTVHEKFSSAHYKNDIALIRLKRSIPFTGESIRPVCLPIGLNLSGNEETKYKVAGWGKTDQHAKNLSNFLLHTTIQGVPRDYCSPLQAPEVKPLDETQMCAGSQSGNDACKGDSGGPLMLVQNSTGKMYQVGIVSFGTFPCGGRDAPSVYTQVSTFINWILKNMKE